MSRLSAKFFRVIVLVLLVTPTLARAESPPADATMAVQQVIENQIAAFRIDDGESAYSFAAPSIKRMFPNSDIFMTMVKRGYPQVYRPQNFSFGMAEIAGDQIVQAVSITGPTGKFWTAIYTLKQQDDGSWKVTGVQLAQPKGADA